MDCKTVTIYQSQVLVALPVTSNFKQRSAPNRIENSRRAPGSNNDDVWVW